MAGITYRELSTSFRKGIRNGNWKQLNHLQRALFRAALGYSKQRSTGDGDGNIVNALLVEKLSALVEKLKETKGMTIFKRGFKKAVGLLKKSEEGKAGVFAWAPQLKHWLRDPDYIFWLGTVR